MPPAVIGGAIAGVGALGAAAIGAGAAKKGSQAISQSTRESGQLQQRQFEQTRADLAPWRQTGGAALGQYAGLLGVPGYGQQPTQQPQQRGGIRNMMYGQPTRRVDGIPSYKRGLLEGVSPQAMSGGYLNQAPQQPTQQPAQQDFRSMLELYPAYQFQMEEGLGAIERTAAARGGLLSGQTLKAAQRYGQGLAGGTAENYLNRLSQLAGVGQTTAVQTGQLGAQSAAYQGQLATQGAQAQASGYLGAANAWGQGIGQIGQLAGYYTGGGGSSNMAIPQNPNLQQYVPQAWGGF